VHVKTFSGVISVTSADDVLSVFSPFSDEDEDEEEEEEDTGA